MRVITPGPAPAQQQPPQGMSRPPEQALYEALQGAILQRRLAPAAALDKATLGQLFGLSSNAVQRALQRLAQDGAVELPANQPARVTRPCAKRAGKLLQARLSLETQILRLLPARLEQAELESLCGQVQRQRDCLQRRDHAGLIEAVNGVHLQLATLADNPWLRDFLARLLRQTALHVALSRTQPYDASACDEQQRLIERLAEGDNAGAETLMEHHLRNLFARLRFIPPPTTDLHAAFAGRLASRATARIRR